MWKNACIIKLLVICSASIALSQQGNLPEIVAGVGWGKVRLGASRAEVESVLGKEKQNEIWNDPYSAGYPEKGIVISFSEKTKKVDGVWFFNKDRGYETAATFIGRTSKGINWDSTEEEVIKAYGKPKEDYSGVDNIGSWRRIVFKGIDFRFINKQLVRISVPGD